MLTRLARQASCRASIATSRPILLRNLKQSATVRATLVTRTVTPSTLSLPGRGGIKTFGWGYSLNWGAFHYGNMPSLIRLEIERLFRLGKMSERRFCLLLKLLRVAGLVVGNPRPLNLGATWQ